MAETKLNRCDSCHNLYEDVEIFDGMRLCPECLNGARGIDEPSGLGDLDDLAMYGEEKRGEMAAEADGIRREFAS